jgi:hypothetical protein
MIRLKNWQIFSLTWLPFLGHIIYGDRPYNEFLRLISMVMLYFGLLRWLWEICVTIPDKIMANSDWINPAKILFIVPTLYFSIIIIGSNTTLFYRFSGTSSGLSTFEISMIVFFFINLFCLIQLFRIASKMIYSMDRSNHKTSEFVLFLFFAFSIVGIWIIQPKINRALKS